MKIILIILVFVFCTAAVAQEKSNLKIIGTVGEYEASVRDNPENELVNLKDFIPDIVLDIKYATKDNFTKTKVYHLARAYARRPVAEALKRAQATFKTLGFGVRIFDAYRPYAATVRFYEIMKGDTTYVASPIKGSRHNRACALDMSIVDLRTGEEVEMPTAYDAMRKESWPATPVADPRVANNRETLISIMQENGFRVYETEWWHFDFTGWQRFDVMDIPFEALEKSSRSK